MNQETLAEYQKIDLSTEEWTQKLAEAPIFLKRVDVVAEVATEETPVTTVLEDGTVETSNVAGVGDVIVTNPDGERYVVKPENFAKSYDATGRQTEDGRPIFHSKGLVRAVQNDTGQPLEIMGSWGKPEFGDADCMIATTYDPENPSDTGSARRIIGYDEFLDTYSPMSPDDQAYSLLMSSRS